MNKKLYRIGLLFCLTVFIILTGVFIFDREIGDTSEPVGVVNPDQIPETKPSEVVVTETLMKPFDMDVSIKRYFYEKDDEATRQAQSLVLFEGVYRPNQGIDFSYNNTVFEVKSSLSGKVIEVKNDPIFGKVIVIESSEGIKITYQSLSDVVVKQGQEVKQGDQIGLSGENIYEADLGNHLHMIVEKNDVVLNPEKCFDKLVNEI